MPRGPAIVRVSDTSVHLIEEEGGTYLYQLILTDGRGWRIEDERTCVPGFYANSDPSMEGHAPERRPRHVFTSKYLDASR